MSRLFLQAINNLIVLLLFGGSASAQIDWSLSANFVAAEAAGGPHLGLAHHIVRDIQEDGKGRMWFATQKGVSCLDGNTFKNYLNTRADSLLWKDWGSHFLTADGTGRIWLATTFKLFYFDEKKDRFVEYDLSGIEPQAKKDSWQSEIYLLDLPDEGAVWFRKNAGLYAIDDRTMTLRKKMTIPLSWRSVSGLLGKDNDGLFWTGGWGPKDLALFQSDGTIQRKINVPFDGIRDMFQQPGENIVWIGTTTLASYNKSTGQWEQWPSGPGYYEGFAMASKLTPEPILWMYPIGKAIVYGFNLKEKKFAYQIPTDKVPSNLFRCSNVECLYVDFDSNIWI
ncbi:MAG: hypothetical protein H7246_01290, partial [Phycisphaerae bacterium]|nr:hypothetical protein [Saprospiraceae bacterium]